MSQAKRKNTPSKVITSYNEYFACFYNCISVLLDYNVAFAANNRKHPTVVLSLFFFIFREGKDSK